MRVLIVDHQLLFAEAVQGALSEQGVEVATARDGRSAMVALDERGADVVLLDVRLPDQSGLEVGRRILERRGGTRVVVLTAAHDAATADEALRIGFSGYLTKDTQLDALMNAIRVVMDGEIVVPPDLVGALRRESTTDHTDLLVAQLTGRELQVLELLTAGRSSDELATALHISRNTLRTHVQSIFAKLGVHSRLEAAAFATRHQLFSNVNGSGRTPVSA